jgi:hypothetical protein
MVFFYFTSSYLHVKLFSFFGLIIISHTFLLINKFMYKDKINKTNTFLLLLATFANFSSSLLAYSVVEIDVAMEDETTEEDGAMEKDGTTEEDGIMV